LEIQNGRRPTCQCPAPLNRPPGRWRRACATAAWPPATSRPRCRMTAGRVCRRGRPYLRASRAGIGHSTISPPHPTSLSVSPLLRFRRMHQAGELLHPPLPSSIHRGCSTLPPPSPFFLRRNTGRSSEPPPRRCSAHPDARHW
jgi:hypothetical protein